MAGRLHELSNKKTKSGGKDNGGDDGGGGGQTNDHEKMKDNAQYKASLDGYFGTI